MEPAFLPEAFKVGVHVKKIFLWTSQQRTAQHYPDPVAALRALQEVNRRQFLFEFYAVITIGTSIKFVDTISFKETETPAHHEEAICAVLPSAIARVAAIETGGTLQSLEKRTNARLKFRKPLAPARAIISDQRHGRLTGAGCNARRFLCKSAWLDEQQ